MNAIDVDLYVVAGATKHDEVGRVPSGIGSQKAPA